MDCDMLMVDDIVNLWALRDDRYAVMVVKHDHQPTEATKFLNQPQTSYEKKNWSSVMMFNGPRCTTLTPEYVNTASGLELHQFKWLNSDTEIGDLPPPVELSRRLLPRIRSMYPCCITQPAAPISTITPPATMPKNGFVSAMLPCLSIRRQRRLPITGSGRKNSSV